MRKVILLAAVTGGGWLQTTLACSEHFQAMSSEPISSSLPSFAPILESSTNDLAPIIPWKLNLTGATGNSPNAVMDPLVSAIQADVQQIWYDTTYVYVKHTGVPSHDTGRADENNPAYASNLNRSSRIPRSPIVATTHAATGNGGIGVMVNGAMFFNPGDAMSYNNQNIWHRNANSFESISFDIGPGHGAPGPGAQPNETTAGTYHYHIGPTALLNQIDAGNTCQHHSPIVGYAFDGFPVYGPYGYSDPNDSGSAIERIESSYRVRTDLGTTSAVRRSLTNGGTQLPSNQWGPNVSAQYPAGCFLEDYEYVAGLGDLNQYNVRFTVTPEYPQGTWAYFMTLDASGTSVYPYIIGPQYWGTLDTANTGPTGGQVSIPASAQRLTVGDANVDGQVNSLDFNALALGYGSLGGALWTDGDFNRDGRVNTVDFNYLAGNFGATTAAALGATLPEPALAWLALCFPWIRRSR